MGGRGDPPSLVSPRRLSDLLLFQKILRFSLIFILPFLPTPATTAPPPPPSKTKKMMRLQIMMHPSRLRHFPVGQSPTSVVLTVAGLTGSTHPLHSLAAKHS